jgi:hypothetical protein
MNVLTKRVLMDRLKQPEKSLSSTFKKFVNYFVTNEQLANSNGEKVKATFNDLIIAIKVFMAKLKKVVSNSLEKKQTRKHFFTQIA